MADINVERRGPSIFPWVIGLIILAVLIWALLEFFGNTDDPDVMVPVDTMDIRPAPSPPPPPAMAPMPPADTATPMAPAGVPDSVGAEVQDSSSPPAAPAG